MPKPFERNIQLGWGKKGQQPSQEDLQVYDFHDEIDNEPVADTPWSMQKKKKEKVKKNYTKKVRKSKQNVKNEESDNDDCEISYNSFTEIILPELEEGQDVEIKPDRKSSKQSGSRRQNTKNLKDSYVDSNIDIDEINADAEEDEQTRTSRSRGKKSLTMENSTNSDDVKTKKNKLTKTTKQKKGKGSMKKTAIDRCEASLASIVAGFEEQDRLAEQEHETTDDVEKMVHSQESNKLGIV